MAQCPFCNKTLPDELLRKEGAVILGRKGGRIKASKRKAKEK